MATPLHHLTLLRNQQIQRKMAGNTMRDRPAAAALLALLLLSFWVAATGHRRGSTEAEEMLGLGRGKGRAGRGLFILGNAKRVVKTDGGEVRLVTGYRWKGDPNPMHIGFIHMEPNTLFIPQYVDSDILLFVRRGEVKIGWIYKDEMVEKELKAGNINNIPAGSAFYMVNTGTERLHIICSIDSSESLGYNSYQSFFIGGGTYPTSVIEGFDDATLTAAFNVTMEDLHPFMRRQISGPIVYWQNEHPRRWAASMLQKRYDDNNGGERREERRQEADGTAAWSWRKLLDYILSLDETGAKAAVSSPESYNLYDRDPSFRNDYGWTVAIDEHDYAPLESSGIGIYLVNLSAGSMLAPHVNPTATEYGIVTAGSGSIQVVFPNGTAAMNAEVSEGDVFWVPRYFPFCQVASRGERMEFFGFTTSARRNRPQFLAGRSSVLRSMRGAELAAGFGVSEERLRRLVRAQREEIILPTMVAEKKSARKNKDKEKEKEKEKKEGTEPSLLLKRGVAFA